MSLRLLFYALGAVGLYVGCCGSCLAEPAQEAELEQRVRELNALGMVLSGREQLTGPRQPLHEVARRLFILGDVDSLVAVLGRHARHEPGVQVVLKTIIREPDFYDAAKVDLTTKLFLATLDWPDDRQEKHGFGYVSSYGFRYRLGNTIYQRLSEGKRGPDASPQLVFDHPLEWLEAQLVMGRGGRGAEVEAAVDRALPLVLREKKRRALLAEGSAGGGWGAGAGNGTGVAARRGRGAGLPLDGDGGAGPGQRRGGEGSGSGWLADEGVWATGVILLAGAGLLGMVVVAVLYRTPVAKGRRRR